MVRRQVLESVAHQAIAKHVLMWTIVLNMSIVTIRVRALIHQHLQPLRSQQQDQLPLQQQHQLLHQLPLKLQPQVST